MTESDMQSVHYIGYHFGKDLADLEKVLLGCRHDYNGEWMVLGNLEDLFPLAGDIRFYDNVCRVVGVLNPMPGARPGPPKGYDQVKKEIEFNIQMISAQMNRQSLFIAKVHALYALMNIGEALIRARAVDANRRRTEIVEGDELDDLVTGAMHGIVDLTWEENWKDRRRLILKAPGPGRLNK
jgi:hypothetical protein